MIKHFEKILKNKRLMRYFIMAVIIVLIELSAFQIIYLFTRDYMLATILSFVLGVVLNWVIGRLVVFGASDHHPAKEFLMVLVASVAGVLIQLGVVYIAVTLLHIYPLLGKALSIIFSFFWNYLFRSRIVYKSNYEK